MQKISDEYYTAPTNDDLESGLNRIFRKHRFVREKVEDSASEIRKIEDFHSLEITFTYQTEIDIGTESAPFHIQHQTTNTTIAKLISLKCSDGAQTRHQLGDLLGMNRGSYERVLPFVRQLGLIDRLPDTRETYQLTPWARQLHRTWLANPGLLAEAIHVHLATRYRTNPAMRASWAYATSAGLLWDRAPLIFEPGTRERLATEIRVAGAAQYGLGLDRVAFSHNSVRGVMNWLGALVPPVIVSPGRAVRIARRTTCPVPAVWWATSELARIGAAARYPGRAPIADEEYRLNLARILFLEPASAEPMLRVASAEAPLHMGEPILAYDPSSMEVRVVRRLPIGILPLDGEGVVPQ